MEGSGRPADPSSDELIAYRRRLWIRNRRADEGAAEPRTTVAEEVVWHCHRCSTTWKSPGDDVGADAVADGEVPACWCCEQNDEVRPGPAPPT